MRSSRSSSPPTARRRGSATACRRRCGPPPLAARPWRWSSACVDSHTVRKHSTWRHRPDATASIALTIEPDCPGVSGAAADPRRAHAQHVLDRGGAPLRVPARGATAARVRRQAVDVVAGETGVGDGADARLDRERERIAHQPATDLRHPDPRDRHLVLELVGRRHRPGVPDRLVLGGQRPGLGVAGGREQREPHVVLLLELAPPPSCRRARRVGLAPDDVRGEAHPVVLLERDHRDRRTAGSSWGATGGVFTVYPTTVPRPDTSTTSISVEWQYGQTGSGREEQRAARDAALHPQHTVAAGGPEELVLGRELRQRALVGRPVGVGHPATLNAPRTGASGVRGRAGLACPDGALRLVLHARIRTRRGRDPAPPPRRSPVQRRADRRPRRAGRVAARGADGLPRAGPGRLQQPGPLPPAAADRSGAGRRWITCAPRRRHCRPCWSWGSRCGSTTSCSTSPRSCTAGTCSASSRRATCRTTASSTRSVTSARLVRPPSTPSRCSATRCRSGPTSSSTADDLDDFAVSRRDLRGPLGADPAEHLRGDGRRHRGGEPVGQQRHHRQGGLSPGALRGAFRPDHLRVRLRRRGRGRVDHRSRVGRARAHRGERQHPRRVGAVRRRRIAGRRPTSTSTGSSPIACG